MFRSTSTPLAAWAGKAALLFALGGSLAAPARATTHNETADAGQTQASAQNTVGPGPLTDILGSLASPTDADLYLIRITNPATFSASTVNPAGGFLDTQLFLLSATGAPLFLNDDDGAGLSVLSRLPASSGFASLAAGLYLLGVSMSGYDPVNINNQLLFAAGLTTAVRGAAPGLQPALLGGFADDTFFPDPDHGGYDIQLAGASPALVPEPEIGVMLLVGGAFCACAGARRRRRQSAAATAA